MVVEETGRTALSLVAVAAADAAASARYKLG